MMTRSEEETTPSRSWQQISKRYRTTRIIWTVSWATSSDSFRLQRWNSPTPRSSPGIWRRADILGTVLKTTLLQTEQVSKTTNCQESRHQLSERQPPTHPQRKR